MVMDDDERATTKPRGSLSSNPIGMTSGMVSGQGGATSVTGGATSVMGGAVQQSQMGMMSGVQQQPVIPMNQATLYSNSPGGGPPGAPAMISGIVSGQNNAPMVSGMVSGIVPARGQGPMLSAAMAQPMLSGMVAPVSGQPMMSAPIVSGMTATRQAAKQQNKPKMGGYTLEQIDRQFFEQAQDMCNQTKDEVLAVWRMSEPNEDAKKHAIGWTCGLYLLIVVCLLAGAQAVFCCVDEKVNEVSRTEVTVGESETDTTVEKEYEWTLHCGLTWAALGSLFLLLVLGLFCRLADAEDEGDHTLYVLGRRNFYRQIKPKRSGCCRCHPLPKNGIQPLETIVQVTTDTVPTTDAAVFEFTMNAVVIDLPLGAALNDNKDMHGAKKAKGPVHYNLHPRVYCFMDDPPRAAAAIMEAVQLRRQELGISGFQPTPISTTYVGGQISGPPPQQSAMPAISGYGAI
ncbi:unnamed protein product [Amoebophrya sp. A120]|nr:unnamed protein product [Amoebophrya sp. A120]|eukprot:GSA120T00002600001.1